MECTELTVLAIILLVYSIISTLAFIIYILYTKYHFKSIDKTCEKTIEKSPNEVESSIAIISPSAFPIVNSSLTNGNKIYEEYSSIKSDSLHTVYDEVFVVTPIEKRRSQSRRTIEDWDEFQSCCNFYESKESLENPSLVSCLNYEKARKTSSLPIHYGKVEVIDGNQYLRYDPLEFHELPLDDVFHEEDISSIDDSSLSKKLCLAADLDLCHPKILNDSFNRTLMMNCKQRTRSLCSLSTNSFECITSDDSQLADLSQLDTSSINDLSTLNTNYKMVYVSSMSPTKTFLRTESV